MNTTTTGELAVLPDGTGQPTRTIAAPPEQVPQQAPVSTASGETLVLILCAALVAMAWRKSKSVRAPLFAAIVAGVLLAGSVAGLMVHQMAGSAGTQLENMVGGVSNGTGTGTGAP